MAWPPVPSRAPSSPAPADPDQRRADRLAAIRQLQQMKEHHGQDSARGGRLRAAIFGINDGLVSNASLVVGVAAAEPANQFIVLAGIAGLVAGAVSMATGEYISMTVQREVFEAQIALEQRELEESPEHEREEISVIFRAKGLPFEDAERIADHVMADPEVALDLMAREELGLNPDDLGSPWGAATSSFLSFATGALLPVLPYLLTRGLTALALALGLTALALFVVGSLTARLTGRPRFFGGLRMLLVGALATGVTYVVGKLIGVATH